MYVVWLSKSRRLLLLRTLGALKPLRILASFCTIRLVFGLRYPAAKTQAVRHTGPISGSLYWNLGLREPRETAKLSNCSYTQEVSAANPPAARLQSINDFKATYNGQKTYKKLAKNLQKKRFSVKKFLLTS